MRAFLCVGIFTFLAVTCYPLPEIDWQRCLGGSAQDLANCISKTEEGKYIIAGGSCSNDGNLTENQGGWDYWIVLTDTSGTIEWQNSLGGSEDDIAFAVQQTTDGGYIATGECLSKDGDISDPYSDSWYDYWIVKLDSSGALLWEKSLGGTDSDRAYSLCATADNGTIIAGGTHSTDGDLDSMEHHGQEDFWVVKIDSLGTIDWQNLYGGSMWERAHCIRQTEDGGFIVVGYSDSNDGDLIENQGIDDYWIVKLDSTGIIEWQRSLGGSHIDKSYAVEQTSDLGYIVVGYSRSSDGDVTINHGLADYWIVKLDSTGTMEWQKSLGGSEFDSAYAVQQTEDLGYIITGKSFSDDGDITGNHGDGDYWLVKLDQDGNLVWQKTMGGSYYETSNSLIRISEYFYITAGGTSSDDGDVSGNHGSSDFWIVKFSVSPLFPPSNLIIYRENENLVLEWDAVAGATTYKIYSDLYPDGEFNTMEVELTGDPPPTEWSTVLPPEIKKFYRLTAE